MPQSKTEELIAALTADIESGRLQPGDKLPSATELRAQYNVSITVYRRAIDYLKAVGLVEGKSGVGVFVREVSSPPGDG